MSLLTKLIKQAKDPEGFVGKIMIHIMNLAHDHKTKWGLNQIKIEENAIILDIGCGGGNTINQLVQRISKGKIYGIDYSQDCVRTTLKKNKKYVKAGIVEVTKASVSDMLYSNDFFDYIKAVQTHYFWPNSKNDIQEVYRILKKKGSFIIISEI